MYPSGTDASHHQSGGKLALIKVPQFGKFLEPGDQLANNFKSTLLLQTSHRTKSTTMFSRHPNIYGDYILYRDNPLQFCFMSTYGSNRVLIPRIFELTVFFFFRANLRGLTLFGDTNIPSGPLTTPKRQTWKPRNADLYFLFLKRGHFTRFYVGCQEYILTRVTLVDLQTNEPS